MKKIVMALAVAFVVALMGACNPSPQPSVTPPATVEKPETTPPAPQETPVTPPAATVESTPAPSTAATETTPPAAKAKRSLADTAWDFTWENAKYKRLEFTSGANVTLKNEASEAGIPGTYTLADDGTFTLTAGDINESGAFDGTVLKVAGVDGRKDPIFPDEFEISVPNEASSRHLKTNQADPK